MAWKMAKTLSNLNALAYQAKTIHNIADSWHSKWQKNVVFWKNVAVVIKLKTSNLNLHVAWKVFENA